MSYIDLAEEMGVSRAVCSFCMESEADLSDAFKRIDRIQDENQWKVLHAMQKHRISERHFESSTGYGIVDDGRDALEKVYAEVFGAEDALVRGQIISGTHALTIALSSCLRPGDEVLYATGAPYDTLQGVIGIRKEPGALTEFSIGFHIAELKDGLPDRQAIRNGLHENTRLVEIQRSKGYGFRHSLSVEEIGDIICEIRAVRPDVIIMVDNCYGEFTETVEPPQVGADLTVGSLIKNPGGGLAPVGGYIVGRKDLIDLCAARLSAPGIGKEGGPSLGLNRPFFQGFFLAPQVTAGAVKTAMLAGEVFHRLGYCVSPDVGETHYDIVQAIAMESPEKVLAFCKGIQAAAPVDSYAAPEPFDMPGYDCQVVMAAGAFHSGASIELSADAPMVPPYTVYFQGGLTYSHGKFGVMKALQTLVDEGLVVLQ